MNKHTINYFELFWLFMAGNVLGVLIEGVFCYVVHGYWETHTVAIWGPFCIIYGIGAVCLYIGAIVLEKQHIIVQFLIYASVATVIEYLCGILLKYGLHMRAWDYSGMFLNIDGIVCFSFSVIWGLFGIAFAKWCVSPLRILFMKSHGRFWDIATIGFSVFMAINLVFTSLCLIRWSKRYHGVAPQNSIEQYIDMKWDNQKMQKRFCEWKFIEDK